MREQWALRAGAAVLIKVTSGRRERVAASSSYGAIDSRRLSAPAVLGRSRSACMPRYLEASYGKSAHEKCYVSIFVDDLKAAGRLVVSAIVF